RFSERDRVSRFGALFARLGSTVVAGEILMGSAADEAGLHWFDVIVAVDGKPLERWTREEIDRQLEEGEAGSVHRVTYRRFDLPEPEHIEAPGQIAAKRGGVLGLGVAGRGLERAHRRRLPCVPRALPAHFQVAR